MCGATMLSARLAETDEIFSLISQSQGDILAAPASALCGWKGNTSLCLKGLLQVH